MKPPDQDAYNKPPQNNEEEMREGPNPPEMPAGPDSTEVSAVEPPPFNGEATKSQSTTIPYGGENLE